MQIEKPNSNTEGKEEFSRWLTNNSYENVSIPSTRGCTYDVEAEFNGVIYYFELKNRNYRHPCKSDKYGDNIIQLDKLERLLTLQDENHRCFVVNFFDDCVYINPISRPYTIQNHNCCKTTMWGGPRIEKQIVSWDHSVCQRVEYSTSSDYYIYK